MKVRIRAFAKFADLFGKYGELDLPEGSTLREAIVALCDQIPERQEAMFDPSGEIRSYVIVVLNGARVGRGALSSAELKEGDELALLPPVAGG